ncbi:MAG: YciK family oxidoreductase [Nitrosomonas sp.]|nr:YciK family oxidoreductase [Nitrosomonas sp.]MDP1950351.1 YciK family oxidoreductase [Nitrosomonas sp.]
MRNFKNYSITEDLLKDRVILVTGAGQGMGRVAALTYATYGATVILHGRKVDKLECVYDEIETLGKAQAAIHPLDFEKSTEKDFAIMAQAITQQLGRLDGILHNAAFLFGVSPLEIQTLEQWQAMMQVNLLAPFALTRACLPLLKCSSDACVIMTSDTHGHNPTAYWGGFAVAKAGVEALVKIQAEEWEIMPNLRINTVIPGPVNTPQRAKTHPGEVKHSLTQPEDLMSTYLYLMGPDSIGINGQTIFCQGDE